MVQPEMVPPTFSYLADSLLRGGIAPRRVRRTVVELQDHYADLYDEAVTRGLSAQDAEQEARSRLGKEQDLIKEVLSQQVLRSWSSRYPWAIYGLGPAFFAIVVAIVPVLIFVLLMDTMTSEQTTVYLPPDWMQSALIQNLTDGVFFLASYIMPLIIAGYVCYQVSIQRDALGWPILGVVLLCTIAASYTVNITWSDLPETQFHLSAGFDLPGFAAKSKMPVRTLSNLTLVAIFMAWCRTRYRPHKKCPVR